MCNNIKQKVPNTILRDDNCISTENLKHEG